MVEFRLQHFQLELQPCPTLVAQYYNLNTPTPYLSQCWSLQATLSLHLHFPWLNASPLFAPLPTGTCKDSRQTDTVRYSSSHRIVLYHQWHCRKVFCTSGLGSKCWAAVRGFGSVGPGNGMWVVGIKYVVDESQSILVVCLDSTVCTAYPLPIFEYSSPQFEFLCVRITLSYASLNNILFYGYKHK